jgi:hypothetical protein
MGRRAIGLGLAAAVALIATAAEARIFVVLRSPVEGWTLYDPAAVEDRPGGVVRRVSTITVRRAIMDDGPEQPGYVRTLADYDCVQRQVRWQLVDAFARDGSLLVTQRNTAEGWRAVAADGETQAIYDALCTGAAPRSVMSGESIGSIVSALMSAWDPPPKPPKPAPAKAGPKNAPKKK